MITALVTSFFMAVLMAAYDKNLTRRASKLAVAKAHVNRGGDA